MAESPVHVSVMVYVVETQVVGHAVTSTVSHVVVYTVVAVGGGPVGAVGDVQ